MGAAFKLPLLDAQSVPLGAEYASLGRPPGAMYLVVWSAPGTVYLSTRAGNGATSADDERPLSSFPATVYIGWYKSVFLRCAGEGSSVLEFTPAPAVPAREPATVYCEQK